MTHGPRGRRRESLLVEGVANFMKKAGLGLSSSTMVRMALREKVQEGEDTQLILLEPTRRGEAAKGGLQVAATLTV